MRHASILGIAVLAMGVVHAQEERPLMAVNDFDNQGIARTEATVLSERFRASLQKTGAVRLIERGQMETILKEQGFQQSGCTSDACAVEVGQLLGVKKIVVGSVGVAGSYTVLSARVLDVATGEVVLTEDVQTRGGVDDLVEKGVDQLARTIGAALSGKPLAEQSAVAQSDTLGRQSPVAQDSSAAAAQNAVVEPKRKRRAGPIVAVVAGAVVIGGGVTLAVLLAGGSDESDDSDESSTVRVTLP
jgi:TolB-like protein